MEAPAAHPVADDTPDRARLDLPSLPPPGELLDSLRGALGAWLPTRRWFAHREEAADPAVRIAAWAPLPPTDRAAVLWTVLAVGRAEREVRYQVPLVLLPEDAAADGTVAGTAVVARNGPLLVADALETADGRNAVLALVSGRGGTLGPDLRLQVDAVRAPALPRPPADPLAPGAVSRVLRGEQSNTSVILEQEDRTPVILKVFRLLGDGENPDVVLQSALTAAGSDRVPAVLGSARIAAAGLRTHALVAQEGLPGGQDAWRTLQVDAAAGTAPTGPLHELGGVLAAVHEDLARALGTQDADPAAVAAAVDGMRRRLAEVAAEVPAVAEHRAALGSLLDAAAEVSWPALQRIHGDLHLGQVLAVPGRGWVLLDFEGEPLRPLAERRAPDCPLRDVAGMLRSLDYAGAVTARERGRDTTAWSAASREAFLDGYLLGAGTPPDDRATAVVLAAFEADKAVYEALYEARNRPDWIDIPLGAIARISAATRSR